MIKQLSASIKRAVTSIVFPHLRRSYSQSGEDIIISDLFNRLGIAQPTYLDIGANEPMALSNTYRLYTRGSKGVCVEPNPILFEKLRMKRKKDVCINKGVAFDERSEATYFMFPEKFHGLNTFSEEEANFWETTGTTEIGKAKIEKKISIPLVNINDLMKDYFNDTPNFISIDVEGLDLPILQTIDFQKHQPNVFCIETLGYDAHGKEYKKNEIIDFMLSKGYVEYANTYINSIFWKTPTSNK